MGMSSLGDVYRQQRNFIKAEPLLISATGRLRKVVGSDHPETLKAMSKLASLYHAEDRDHDAELLFQKTLEQQRKTIGAEDEATLGTADRLAQLYEDEHGYAKADAIYEGILEIRVRKFGRDKPITAQAIESVGRVHLEQKQYDEAVNLLKEASAVWEKSQPQGIDRFETQSLLGAALVGQGKYAEAEPQLLSSYDQLQKLSVTFARPIPSGGDRIVELYDRWQKPEKAVEWRHRIAESPLSRHR